MCPEVSRILLTHRSAFNGIMHDMNFLALYRDVGPCSDGHSKVIGIFEECESAWDAIFEDAYRYKGSFSQGDACLGRYGGVLYAQSSDGVGLCEWEVVEI